MTYVMMFYAVNMLGFLFDEPSETLLRDSYELSLCGVLKVLSFGGLILESDSSIEALLFKFK